MIRLAVKEDVKEIVLIYNDAKKLLKDSGSDQWQDKNGYPNEETILNDILLKQLFVYIEENIIKGCIVVSKELEEAYLKVYNGSWSNNDKYTVIHRLAVKKEFYRTGIGKKLIQFSIDYTSKQNIYTIRTDTKIENIKMQSLLKSFSFKHVGKVILLMDNSVDNNREAYELLIGNNQ